jgi:ABC-type lipoprotein export system ATPase subunit
MTPTLEARAVSRTFTPRGGGAPVDAVRGVNIAVHPGDFLVIAGPSGSGQTTLLHLLAAIDSPTSGEVLIEGAQVTRLSAKAKAETRLKRLGLLFSDESLGVHQVAVVHTSIQLRFSEWPRMIAPARFTRPMIVSSSGDLSIDESRA